MKKASLTESQNMEFSSSPAAVKENSRRKKLHLGMFGSIFMFPDRYDVVLMTVGVLGSIADGVTVPCLFLFYAKLVNTIGSTANSTSVITFSQHIKQNSLILCFIGCAQWLACFLEGYCWSRTSERQASRLRIKYMKAVMRQDVAYFDLHITSSAEVVTNVSNDTLIIQDVINEKVPVFLTSLSTFVSGYVVSFILLWRLALVSFPFVLLLVVPGLVHGRTLMRIGRKLRVAYNKADIIVEQAVSSVRTVYSFVGEMKTITDYSKALEDTLRLGLEQGLVKGLAIGSSGVIFAIWAFITYYSCRLIIHHGAKGGNVYLAGASMMVGGLAFGSCLPNIKYFVEARAAGERIMEVIQRVPVIDSNNVEGRVLENVLGEVEFNHVEFSYPTRPDSKIFIDFSMRVPAGENVALVGGSGSGKSTVISLLQRFYNPIEGEILFDGVPINKLHLKWLRSQMGLVSQEPVLFATTIKENILFGKEDASMEEVIESAKASNAHSFIIQLPKGYDTQVGERGIQLSGGQKQRIAIARAIIKAPKILLLDEATSALDSESERIVQEALDQAAVGRTTIVIAHRLSTIRNADTIVVLEHCQVKEIGSHDELMADSNGLYASLVHLQENNNNNRELADVDASVSSSSGLNTYEVHGTSCRRLSRRFSSMSRCSSASADALSKSMGLAIVSKDQVSVVPSFWRLLLMNRPEWKQAILGCTGALLFGAVQPVYAFIMGSLISVYFSKDPHEIKRKSNICSLTFLGIAIFSLIINICQHYNFAVMGENLTKRIREKMLLKLLTFEAGWFDQDENATGAICSSLARDAGAVRSLVGDRISILIQAFSAAIVSCTMGLAIAWKLALVMISAQPFIIMCFYCKKTVLQNVSAKSIESQNESSKIAVEVVSNLRTITSFSSQDRIIQLLEKAHEIQRKETVHLSWIAGLLLGTSQSILTFTWALSFWYGGKLIAEGYLGTKEFLQTVLILVSTGRVIGEAGSMTSDIAAGASAVESVFTVLNRISPIDPEDSEGFKPKKLTGEINLLNVHFAYPTRPTTLIFRGFSVDIEAGKSTALVGQSGSGKSTIIGLIERFYDPIKGTVMIDGRDIKSYHLRSLRRHIALVSQEPVLFATTVRQNIIYGTHAQEHITESELVEAAKAANAHEFIAGLENGYDTFCGDRGLQLSGGQKQRIAIARAILRNPAILLLDEATSALDSHSEKVVQDSLKRVIVGRTSVVVAHRLSTIRNCDLIAVLEQGKIVEKGTHASLLAKGPTGAYSSLVSLQIISEVDAPS